MSSNALNVTSSKSDFVAQIKLQTCVRRQTVFERRLNSPLLRVSIGLHDTSYLLMGGKFLSSGDIIQNKTY